MSTSREWPFLDSPNTAVFTTVPVIDDGAWVHYVTHDDEDGAWQFHHQRTGSPSVKEAVVTSLKRMLVLEPRIAELADLPLGWHAWRDSENAPWTRAPKEVG